MAYWLWFHFLTSRFRRRHLDALFLLMLLKIKFVALTHYVRDLNLRLLLLPTFSRTDYFTEIQTDETESSLAALGFLCSPWRVLGCRLSPVAMFQTRWWVARRKFGLIQSQSSSCFRDLCHDAWNRLRLSPMFGCICPNNHMKRRCDRIFSIVNHNPCVGKWPLSLSLLPARA